MNPARRLIARIDVKNNFVIKGIHPTPKLVDQQSSDDHSSILIKETYRRTHLPALWPMNNGSIR